MATTGDSPLEFLLAPPREGRPAVSVGVLEVQPFLLAPPREGRRSSTSATVFLTLFLLAPPREGRPDRHHPVSHPQGISTRAPTGGATPGPPCAGRSCGFLLAPPREGRLAQGPPVHHLHQFLLAPPREGRLSELSVMDVQLEISTRAPTGGATFAYTVHQTAHNDFYSRPHGRGDQPDG